MSAVTFISASELVAKSATSRTVQFAGTRDALKVILSKIPRGSAATFNSLRNELMTVFPTMSSSVAYFKVGDCLHAQWASCYKKMVHSDGTLYIAHV